MIGAVAAYLLWAMLLHRLPARFAIVALGLCRHDRRATADAVQFVATPQSFRLGTVRQPDARGVGPAVQVFCEDFFEYGGLIWLLGHAGVVLPLGTFVTAALLLAVSYVECWLPGRPAEITDAFMAVVIGGAFMLLRYAARRRTDNLGPTTACCA